MKDALKTLNSSRAAFFLLVFICCIVAGAVLKLTTPVILPFTIAILMAFVVYPLIMWLDKYRIPRALSIFLVVAIMIFGFCTLGMVIYSFGRTILSLFPRYENRLTEIYLWFARFLELSYDEDMSFFQNLWNQMGIRVRIWDITYSFSNSFVDFIRNAFMIVLFMIFLLVEATQFNEKLELAF